MSTAATAPPRSRGREAAAPTPSTRLAGVDAARGLAVVGMLAAHLGPSWAQPGTPWVWDLAQGPPSALFVLVTGIVLAHTTQTTATLARRAGALLVLGIALATIHPPVWIILQVTACLLVAGSALRRLPTRALLAVAVAMLLAGPIIVAGGRDLSPGIPGSLQASDLQHPLQSVWLLLVTGAYPAVVWLVPLSAGLLIGRLDLTAPRTLRRLLAGALVGLAVARTLIAAAAPHTVGDVAAARSLDARLGGVPHIESRWLLGGWPHAGTTLELASAVLVAIAGLAALCLLARAGRALPLVLIGRLALTTYVTQVLLLTVWPQLTAHAAGDAVFLVAILAACAAIAAHLILARWQRGPLEALLHAAARGRSRWHGNRA